MILIIGAPQQLAVVRCALAVRRWREYVEARMRRQSEQCGRHEDGRRVMPAEMLDPQAKHNRAGKLAETASLLQQSDGRRQHGRAWGGMRSCRIECAGRKTADSERQRGDERDALRRKHVAIHGKA